MQFLSSIPLVVTSALVIFSPLQEGGTTHVAQMIIRFLILAWAGGALALSIRQGRLTIPLLSVRYFVLVFLGFAVIATMFSPYAHPSRQWLFTIICYATLFYLLVSFVDRWEHVHTLTIVVVLMGVGEAALTILQGLVWNDMRPSGTFFNPNFLAGYLAVSWAILLSAAVYGYRRTAALHWLPISPTLWWFGVGASLGSLFLAVLLTQSRGGMIVVLVATVFIVMARYGWKVAGSCLVLLMVGGLLIPTPLRERVQAEHQQNPVSYARLQMWQGALTQMAEHPLGIGLGLYQYTYPRYAFPVEGEIARYGKVAQTPHNDYLQMGIEMGVGALLLFLAGVFMVGRDFARVFQTRLSRRQRSLILGLGAGGIALLVHAALDSSLRETALAILLVLCAGLIVSAARMTRCSTDAVQVIPIRSRFVWGMSAACVLLLVGAEVSRLGMAWLTFDAASRRAVAGETDAAIQGLQHAIALDPGKSLYHHGLGSVYARAFDASRDKEMFRLAHAEFKEAIELNPLDSRLLGLLGQLYVSAAQAPSLSGGLDEQRKSWIRAALRVYERAVRLAPFSAPYRYEQARLHWMLGEKAAAEQQAKEAERLEPNFLPARALLAHVWVDAGRIDEARQELHEIQARQARYEQWNKNSIDRAFLGVDVAPLRAAVGEKGLAG
ncbi:MAG TPA: O-antigen ligase family protein [Nitrospira sp.]|jgi:O-antigen ligase|nr:O-antigen ligase family protein [Nitrospira sp.]HRB16234.1 O-antigen ligase family protein [Nitrospira sp.]